MTINRGALYTSDPDVTLSIVAPSLGHLGYPPSAMRPMKSGKPRSGLDLGIPALSADLAPVISAVRHVLRGVILDLRDNAWNDKYFESLLSK